MKSVALGAAGLAFIGSLGLATSAAFAEATVVIQTNPPPANVVVVPRPGPVRAMVDAVTQPDCDTTVKKVEGPNKTTTTVKKDCN